MKPAIYLLVMTLITACSVEPNVSEPPSETITVSNELVVIIAPDADIEVLKAAWQVFDAEVQLLGPRDDGMLKVTLNKNVNIQQAQRNIAATKGVKAVDINYIEYRNLSNAKDAVPKKH